MADDIVLAGDAVNIAKTKIEGSSSSPERTTDEKERPSGRRYVPPAQGLQIEDFEGYKPGGYHPTQIGDTLDNGRFRVIHKVGCSPRSLVWLARDLYNESKLVTLKILIASISNQCKEDKILTFLHSDALSEESIHVPRLLHKFTIDGPNGRHVCLVLPLIGPTLSEYPDARVAAGLSPYLPSDLAVSFGRQIVRVLARLHSCGITHGGM